MPSRFMRLRTLLTLLSLGLMLAPAISAPPVSPAPATMVWTAGNMPPFAWSDPKTGPQGYAYELVVQMAAKLGRPSDVQFYPWARAVRMALEGEAAGVFPLLRTAEREPHFRWLIVLAHVRYVFVGTARGEQELGSLAALRGARVGILRGSPILKNLQAQQFTQVIEATEYKDLLRLLSAGMVDAIYAGEPMLKAAVDEFGFNPRDFRTGMSLGDGDLYLATSGKTDAAESERWLQAYRELQQEGAVAKLQRKYLRER